MPNPLKAGEGGALSSLKFYLGFGQTSYRGGVKAVPSSLIFTANVVDMLGFTCNHSCYDGKYSVLCGICYVELIWVLLGLQHLLPDHRRRGGAVRDEPAPAPGRLSSRRSRADAAGSGPEPRPGAGACGAPHPSRTRPERPPGRVRRALFGAYFAELRVHHLARCMQ